MASQMIFAFVDLLDNFMILIFYMDAFNFHKVSRYIIISFRNVPF